MIRSFTRVIALAVGLCLGACTGGRDSSRAVVVTDSSTERLYVPPCGDRIIRYDGVGNLKLGMHADSVKAHCHVGFDEVWPGPEGMSQRVMMVSYSPDGVLAEIVNDSVWRLNVTSPGFQTADSIRVGTPVADLARRDDVQGMIGEGVLAVVFRGRCGLSFLLTGGIPRGRTRNWNRKELAALPATIRVKKILVFKCPPSSL